MRSLLCFIVTIVWCRIENNRLSSSFIDPYVTTLYEGEINVHIISSIFHTQRSPCNMTGLISSDPIEISVFVHESDRHIVLRSPTKQIRNNTLRSAAAISNKYYLKRRWWTEAYTSCITFPFLHRGSKPPLCSSWSKSSPVMALKQSSQRWNQPLDSLVTPQ